MNEINDDIWEPLSNWDEFKLNTGAFVDLFYIPADQDITLQTHEAILSEVERTYCDSFIKPRDQQIKKVGKIFTRLLLSRYSGIAPAALKIERTIYGKPFCKQTPTIKFNASDAGDIILLAIASNEVGVDIELHNRLFVYDDIMANYFTAHEIAQVNNSIDPLKAFYNVWVIKESLLKAIGTGFGSLNTDVQGLASEVFQHQSYSFAIATSNNNYTLRFFKYLAIKT